MFFLIQFIKEDMVIYILLTTEYHLLFSSIFIDLIVLQNSWKIKRTEIEKWPQTYWNDCPDCRILTDIVECCQSDSLKWFQGPRLLSWINFKPRMDK